MTLKMSSEGGDVALNTLELGDKPANWVDEMNAKNDNKEAKAVVRKMPSLVLARGFAILSIILAAFSFPAYLPTAYWFSIAPAWLDIILTVLAAVFTIFNYWPEFIDKTHQLHHTFNLWVAALTFKFIALIACIVDLTVMSQKGLALEIPFMSMGGAYIFFVVWNIMVNIAMVNITSGVYSSVNPGKRLLFRCDC